AGSGPWWRFVPLPWTWSGPPARTSSASSCSVWGIGRAVSTVIAGSFVLGAVLVGRRGILRELGDLRVFLRDAADFRHRPRRELLGILRCLREDGALDLLDLRGGADLHQEHAGAAVHL